LIFLSPLSVKITRRLGWGTKPNSHYRASKTCWGSCLTANLWIFIASTFIL